MRRIALLGLLCLLAAPPAADGAAGKPRTRDRVAPELADLSVSNGATPFAGDGALLTTVSPNGDGFRDRAELAFTLDEPARVTLEVATTKKVPQVIATRSFDLPAGRDVLSWSPPAALGPRTYVLRLTAVDAAGNRTVYGSPDAFVGRLPRAPTVRVQGVDATFTQQSYAPGQLALLRISTDARSLRLQAFRAGPEETATYANDVMNGEPVAPPVALGWERRRDAPEAIRFRVGAWPSGLYYVQLTADDGRIGYAPFVVRPPELGQHRVAVVLPTYTWQAYNFYDGNGDGWGDTWYAGPPNLTVRLDRPFLNRGVPPYFRRYDLAFLHWLAWTGKEVDYLADSDLASVADGDELARAYDLVVFPGHAEYMTDHAFDVVSRYRDLGGNLAFLSANTFFWRVRVEDGKLRKISQFREAGKPEAALLGVQYRANDQGQHQAPFVVRSAQTAPWLWEGTGLADGATFGDVLGGYGIEIDALTPASPPGTLVLAEIPDVLGPGLTAQMTYYETPQGAKVFAAGALDFGGSATTWPVRRLLENLWARLGAP